MVLECLKVVQCALSCDLNEYFFNISEVKFYFYMFCSPTYKHDSVENLNLYSASENRNFWEGHLYCPGIPQ